MGVENVIVHNNVNIYVNENDMYTIIFCFMHGDSGHPCQPFSREYEVQKVNINTLTTKGYLNID